MRELSIRKQSGTDPAKKTKVASGDKLPSYTVKSEKVKNTPATKAVKAKKVTKSMDKEKSTYNKKVDPSKITPAMTKAANARVKSAKSKDKAASTKAVKAASASKEVVKSSVKKTIGTQTLNDVKRQGAINTSNRMDLARAKTEAAVIKGSSDSTKAANIYLKQKSKGGPITGKQLGAARFYGDRAAIQSVMKSKVAGGRKASTAFVKKNISQQPKG